MITKTEAIELIKEDLNDEMVVMLDSIIEKDYGWVIFSQSKKYIETGDILYMAVESGGVLVEKSMGRKIEFGSAYSTDKNLQIYEKGYFEFDSWDIKISRVNDMQRTIEFLRNLDVSYVLPEEAHGEVWRVPKEYSHKQLKSALSKLPARFKIGSIYFKYDALESFKSQKDFIYSLEENRGFENRI